MKILLVKLNHIGDTLILTPTIRAIRKNFPSAKIDVVVRKGCEGVLEKNPDIDNVVAIAKPEKDRRTFLSSLFEFKELLKKIGFKRYDFAFDLSNSDRAKFILLLSLSKHRGINRWHNPLGWKRFLFTDFSDFAWGREHQVLKDFMTVKEIMKFSDDPGPLYIHTEDISSEILLRYDLKNRKYIVIHPTSRWRFKEWSVEKWKEVLSFFKKQGYEILITCGPDQREIETVHKIADSFPGTGMTEGGTSLRELAFLIANAKLFIGVDTVAMHIAAAVQTPTVALFGPSAEWSWSPWKVPHVLVLGNCPCKLSRKFTCDKSKILPCMDDIGPTEVIHAGVEMLKEKKCDV